VPFFCSSFCSFCCFSGGGGTKPASFPPPPRRALKPSPNTSSSSRLLGGAPRADFGFSFFVFVVVFAFVSSFFSSSVGVVRRSFSDDSFIAYIFPLYRVRKEEDFENDDKKRERERDFRPPTRPANARPPPRALLSEGFVSSSSSSSFVFFRVKTFCLGYHL